MPAHGTSSCKKFDNYDKNYIRKEKPNKYRKEEETKKFIINQQFQDNTTNCSLFDKFDQNHKNFDKKEKEIQQSGNNLNNFTTKDRLNNETCHTSIEDLDINKTIYKRRKSNNNNIYSEKFIKDNLATSSRLNAANKLKNTEFKESPNSQSKRG